MRGDIFVIEKLLITVSNREGSSRQVNFQYFEECGRASRRNGDSCSLIPQSERAGGKCHDGV